MSAFDLWPFTDVSTVERRGELQVLAGTSPDGLPVTITRLTPDTARDATLRRRFKEAVEAATRHTGPDDPPILWADTSTLVPWAATYDDADHRGADLIGHLFESDVTADAQTSHETQVQQQTDSEKSVPALDPNAYGSYDTPAPTHDTPPPQYDTPRPLYDTPRPVEHTTPQPPRPGQPTPPVQPGGPASRPPGGGGGTSGGDGKGGASRTPLFVGLGVGGLVVVLLLGSLIALAATRERDTSGDPGKVPSAAQSSSSTPANVISTAPAKSGTSSPTASSSASGSAKPKLKDVKPVSVYGPTWKKGDSTYLMAFSQLDWAYRAPGDFDCLVRDHTSTKTRITCTKLLGKKPKSRRVLLVDRKCSGKSCSAKEQKKAEKDPWGRKVHNWKRKDKNTKYVTGTFHNKENKKKYFGFYMSHYYKDGNGHRNRHVLAYGDAPAGTKYAKQIQKTINSIRTQSGA